MKIPENLNIPKAAYPNLGEFAREVAEHIQGDKSASYPEIKPPETSGEWLKTILAMATNVWRIKSKIVDPVSHEVREELSKEDLKKLGRYVDAIFESLMEIGIEVKDRTGEPFDYGLPEKVITAQPRLGITKEIVVETFRPTIYLRSQIAQQGEIVIATPLETQETKNV